jgi:hypothetical protein
VICYFGKAEYFCAKGLTGANHVDPADEFSFLMQVIFPVIPGHREAMSPESITTNREYEFRAAVCVRSSHAAFPCVLARHIVARNPFGFWRF